MSSGRRSLSRNCKKMNSEPLPQLTRTKHCRLRSNSRLRQTEVDRILEEEERIGEIEYTKVVIKALKEAINENDRLRKLVNDINKDNEELKEVVDQRDSVILELATYYQFCKDHHVGNTLERKKRNSFNSLPSLSLNDSKRKKVKKK